MWIINIYALTLAALLLPFGVALLGAVLTAGYRGAINAHLRGIPDHAAHTAREGIANALAPPEPVPTLKR